MTARIDPETRSTSLINVTVVIGHALILFPSRPPDAVSAGFFIVFLSVVPSAVAARRRGGIGESRASERASRAERNQYHVPPAAINCVLAG